MIEHVVGFILLCCSAITFYVVYEYPKHFNRTFAFSWTQQVWLWIIVLITTVISIVVLAGIYVLPVAILIWWFGFSVAGYIIALVFPYVYQFASSK